MSDITARQWLDLFSAIAIPLGIILGVGGAMLRDRWKKRRGDQ